MPLLVQGTCNIVLSLLDLPFNQFCSVVVDFWESKFETGTEFRYGNISSFHFVPVLVIQAKLHKSAHGGEISHRKTFSARYIKTNHNSQDNIFNNTTIILFFPISSAAHSHQIYVADKF
jgi:hypothetical protein